MGLSSILDSRMGTHYLWIHFLGGYGKECEKHFFPNLLWNYITKNWHLFSKWRLKWQQNPQAVMKHPGDWWVGVLVAVRRLAQICRALQMAAKSEYRHTSLDGSAFCCLSTRDTFIWNGGDVARRSQWTSRNLGFMNSRDGLWWILSPFPEPQFPQTQNKGNGFHTSFS